MGREGGGRDGREAGGERGWRGYSFILRAGGEGGGMREVLLIPRCRQRARAHVIYIHMSAQGGLGATLHARALQAYTLLDSVWRRVCMYDNGSAMNVVFHHHFCTLSL